MTATAHRGPGPPSPSPRPLSVSPKEGLDRYPAGAAAAFFEPTGWTLFTGASRVPSGLIRVGLTNSPAANASPLVAPHSPPVAAERRRTQSPSLDGAATGRGDAKRPGARGARAHPASVQAGAVDQEVALQGGKRHQAALQAGDERGHLRRGHTTGAAGASGPGTGAAGCRSGTAEQEERVDQRGARARARGRGSGAAGSRAATATAAAALTRQE